MRFYVESNAFAFSSACEEGFKILVELGSNDEALEGEVPYFTSNTAVSQISSALVISKTE